MFRVGNKKLCFVNKRKLSIWIKRKGVYCLGIFCNGANFLGPLAKLFVEEIKFLLKKYFLPVSAPMWEGLVERAQDLILLEGEFFVEFKAANGKNKTEWSLDLKFQM